MAGASAVRAGQAFVEIGADPRKLFAALGKINKQIGQLGSSMSSMGTKLMGVGLAIGAPLAMASRQFASFDDAIRLTGAVSGATGDALQSLNDKARELGATTSFTAVQVATLMGELGRAGFDPTEINNMTGAVLDLARATGTDATLSAGIMAATLRQFGLGATEASRAADVLTKAANSTFNTVEGLGESLKYAGPVAKSLGMSLEDTAAILGVLGNVGIQGSEAGTALRRLSVISAGAGEELKKIFGVTNTDAAGNLKPLVQILDEINTVTASMPVAERTKRMADAFGLLGITSANVLSQSADGVSDLAEKLRNAGGTAAKTAKEMDAGLGGSMRIALSAIEGTALAIGDALSPSLQSLIDGVGNVATGLTKFVKENEALVVSFAKGTAAAVGVGVAIMAIGTSMKMAASTFAVFGAAATAIGLVGTLAASSLASVNAIGIVGYAAAGKLIAGMNAAGNAIVSASGVAFSSVIQLGAAAGTTAVAGFNGLSVAAGRFGVSALTAAQATFPVFFTGFNRSLSAGAGFFASTIRGFRGMALASAGVRAAMASMASSFVATAAKDIAGALTFTYKIFAWWAAGASARLTQYVVNLAGATGATIASAARMAAAWLGSAATGLAAFVGSSVAGIASYIGACAAAVASSVASAAAIAVAWLAPVAPILAIGAALGGAAVLAYQFGGQIKSALGGIGELAGQAGSAIGSAFGQVVSDASVVFGDLAATATTTFNGIYEAIASGDLAGAMDILWAGLNAAWLRGSEAIMGYVDPWIAMFQNTFTYLGTTIATTWESLWSGLIQLLNTDKAIIMGVFDNLINGVMAAFDTMVAAVRKSWNWVQSFIVKGYDLAKENQKVDSEMAARARERSVSRPGIAGRTAQAAKENAQTARETQARIDAMNRGADETAQATIDRNATAAAGRREATMAAEGRLTDLTRGARDRRIYGQQAADLEKEIGNTGSLDALRSSADEFRAMRDLGLLTSEQITRFETALDDAAERIVAGGSQGLKESAAAVDPEAMARAAASASQSQAEVAGTFSAQSLSGMGFGQSLAQKQLDTLKAIEQNTRVGDDGLVAA